MRAIAPVLGALLLVPFVCAAQETALLSRSYVVVTDRTSDSVLRFETNGTFKDEFVRVGFTPEAVTFGPDQNVYITNAGSSSVERYNGATGKYIGRFAQAPLRLPEGLAFGPDGHLYVVDRRRSAVLRFDGGTGAYIDEFVKGGAGGYNNASGITFGPDNNLYLTSGSPSQLGEAVSPQILRFDGRTGAFMGVFVTTASGGLNAPFTLIFGPDRNLYVSSVLTHSILRYNGKTGAFIDAFVPTNSGGLSRPTGLSFGPDGNLYVASSYGSTVGILRYNGVTGAFIDQFINAGAGGLAGPTGVLWYSFESVIAPVGHDTTIAADLLGNRAVGWIENGVVKAQAFDPDGKSVGPVRSLSTAGSASRPRIIAASAGRFLATWSADPAGGAQTRVYAQPLLIDGRPAASPSEISLPPAGFHDEVPSVALAGNKAALCWLRKDASDRGVVMARLVDANTGLPAGGEASVSSSAVSSADAPVIASDSHDLVAIAWRDQKVGSPAKAIVLALTTSALDFFPSRVVDDGSAGSVGEPSICGNPAGLMMLAWPQTTNVSSLTAPQSTPRVRIKVLPVGSGSATASDAELAFAPTSAAFTVNADEFRDASSPQITVGLNGVAGVVWRYAGLSGGTGVYGRTVNVSGVIDRSDFVVFDAADANEIFLAPAIAVDVSGTLTISSHKTVGATSSVFTRTRLQEKSGPSRRRSVNH